MNKSGVYVHIPFCVKKCAYCDFVSYENRTAEAPRYTDAVLREAAAYRGTAVDSIYIGGGTPTALPPGQLVRLLAGLFDIFTVAPQAEITVEANPGTADEAYFAALAAAGVNRLSLGVQSFCDDELSALGRIHSAKEAEAAVRAAYRAGIFNLSLDLMFSIPRQTQKSLQKSLETAVSLPISHISCYSLTICENTPFGRLVKEGQMPLPDEDTDRAFYTQICEFLDKNGLARYEISNFARPGREARHNTKYWRRVPYIGLGAAAHSFWENRRFENPPQTEAYYAVVYGAKERSGEVISPADAMSEFMFLGLRMTREGISSAAFAKAFGTELDAVYGRQIEKLLRLGLLEKEGDRLRLTGRGIDVSNSVFCEFV